MKLRTILAVDDNEDNLDLVEDALAGTEFKVIRARSGPGAMSLLMSQHCDIVLLDIMMPEMNGFALLEMIRFIPRLMNTTVIFMTAHGDGWNTKRAEGLGAKIVLHKPILPSELLQQVRGLLSSTAFPSTASKESCAVRITDKPVVDATIRGNCCE